jgi:hypothetical protein
MKKKYIELFKKHIKRDGAEELLEWLEKTDFFFAPASSRFHGAYEGGLVSHSINVFEQLVDLVSKEETIKILNTDIENLAVIGLLHDVCKANTYEVYQRNVKNEDTKKWEKVDSYRFKNLRLDMEKNLCF